MARPTGVDALPGRLDPHGGSTFDAAAKIELSRDTLARGVIHHLLARSGVPLPVLTDEELRASIARTLAAKPNTASIDIWLFAYGSLIWNPAFHCAERKTAMVRGWHRRFCLSAPVGRGTPDHPGLVLGLDSGGECHGVAYRLCPRFGREELLLVWGREMATSAYVPQWVEAHLSDGRCIPAIAFAANKACPAYEGVLPDEVLRARIATTTGELGSCAEYLFRTVEALECAGALDPELSRLAQQVKALQERSFGAVGGKG